MHPQKHRAISIFENTFAAKSRIGVSTKYTDMSEN